MFFTKNENALGLSTSFLIQKKYRKERKNKKKKKQLD